jgi:two-component system, sensor histidine kinase and response regulator
MDRQASTLFDMLPLGAYRSSADGTHVRPNLALARMNGFDSVAAMQTESLDIAKHWYVLPGRRQEFLDQIVQLGQVRDFVSEVFRYRTRERIWVRENAHAVLNEFGELESIEGTVEDISAEVRTKAALQERSRALQDTLDVIEHGVIRFDNQHRVSYYSRRAALLLNLSPDMLNQRPSFAQLVAFQQQRGDLGEDFSLIETPSFRDKLREQFNLSEVVRGNYIRRTVAGRYIQVHSHLLHDGSFMKSYSDVTDFVSAQQAMAAQRLLLQTVIDAIPDSVAYKELGGVYLLSNVTHAALLGMTPDQVVGQRINDLTHDVHADLFAKTDEQALQSKSPVVYETEWRNPDTGEFRLYETAKLAVRNPQGHVQGLLAIGRDITRRKRTEAELIAARDAAQAAGRAKEQFLANMSHELRTPLNAVVGLADVLAQQRLSADQLDSVHTIRNSAEALVGLINDVLDFSKLEAGALDLDVQSMALHKVVEDALDMAVQAGRGKAIDVSYWIEDDVPAVVLADVMRMRQVLVNLVHNAVKFTSAGEVHITVARVLRNQSERLRITVSDTGEGIAPERIEKLFTSFSQGDASTTRRHGGTGLGLAICKRIVEKMGGLVAVQSAVGQGSDFQFEVPLTAHAGSKTVLELAAQHQLKGCVVAVLVDAPRARRATEGQLARWGADVLSCADPADLIRTLQTNASVTTIFVQLPGQQRNAQALLKTAAEVAKSAHPDRQQAVQVIWSLPRSSHTVPPMDPLWRVVYRPLKSAVLWHSLNDPMVGAPQRLAQVAQAAGIATRLSVSAPAATPVEPPPAQRISEPSSSAWADSVRPTGFRGSLPGGPSSHPGAAFADSFLAGSFRPSEMGAGAPDSGAGRSRPHAEDAVLGDLHVLVAEDNIVNQKLMARMLQHCGEVASFAENGERALRSVKNADAAGLPIQLIFMDVQMPELDGLQATSAIRALPLKQQPYIVGLTANARPSDRQQCLDAGMDDYYSKPVRLKDIEQILAKARALHVHAPGAAE